jgi:hypothetical protein
MMRRCGQLYGCELAVQQPAEPCECGDWSAGVRQPPVLLVSPFVFVVRDVPSSPVNSRFGGVADANEKAYLQSICSASRSTCSLQRCAS